MPELYGVRLTSLLPRTARLDLNISECKNVLVSTPVLLLPLEALYMFHLASLGPDFRVKGSCVFFSLSVILLRHSVRLFCKLVSVLWVYCVLVFLNALP